MIAYQVPVVMRHLKPMQIFDEGVTSFTAVGIFSLLASLATPVSPDLLNDLTEIESYNDIHCALQELEELKLIEQIEIVTDADSIARELIGKIEEVRG